MLKSLLKRLVIGIAMGSTILNLLLLITKLSGSEAFFTVITNDYIRQSLCAMLVPTTFGVLGIVYIYDHLPFGLKVLIHMGGGLVVYFLVAWYANWIPIQAGFSTVLTMILMGTVITFGVWFCFYLYYRKEAKKINSRINKIN